MMKHAVQGVHVQLPIMHTSNGFLLVQCMKALTCMSQIHLNSSMVLLSVESAATATSTGTSFSSTVANLCFPLKNLHRAARSKQRGSTIKFRDKQFYQSSDFQISPIEWNFIESWQNLYAIHKLHGILNYYTKYIYSVGLF